MLTDYLSGEITPTMIKYQLTITINKPLKEVTALFANRKYLPQWQPGLLSSDQIESFPHPKYKLKFLFGRRTMIMTETILRHQLPKHFDGTYEMKGMLNRLENSFEETAPNVTKWSCDCMFTFSGRMRFIAFFMKANFKKQSMILMNNFKRFAEAK